MFYRRRSSAPVAFFHPAHGRRKRTAATRPLDRRDDRAPDSSGPASSFPVSAATRSRCAHRRRCVSSVRTNRRGRASRRRKSSCRPASRAWSGVALVNRVCSFGNEDQTRSVARDIDRRKRPTESESIQQSRTSKQRNAGAADCVRRRSGFIGWTHASAVNYLRGREPISAPVGENRGRDERWRNRHRAGSAR